MAVDRLVLRAMWWPAISRARISVMRTTTPPYRQDMTMWSHTALVIICTFATVSHNGALLAAIHFPLLARAVGTAVAASMTATLMGVS